MGKLKHHRPPKTDLIHIGMGQCVAPPDTIPIVGIASTKIAIQPYIELGVIERLMMRFYRGLRMDHLSSKERGAINGRVWDGQKALRIGAGSGKALYVIHIGFGEVLTGIESSVSIFIRPDAHTPTSKGARVVGEPRRGIPLAVNHQGNPRIAPIASRRAGARIPHNAFIVAGADGQAGSSAAFAYWDIPVFPVIG